MQLYVNLLDDKEHLLYDKLDFIAVSMFLL